MARLQLKLAQTQGNSSYSKSKSKVQGNLERHYKQTIQQGTSVTSLTASNIIEMDLRFCNSETNSVILCG